MTVVVSHNKARRMVTPIMWLLLLRGYAVYSRDMKWQISKGGYLYTACPCSARW